MANAPGMVSALGVDLAVTARREVSAREVSGCAVSALEVPRREVSTLEVPRREDLDPFVKGIV